MTTTKATILLVDDDPAILITIGDVLQFKGYNVITATSAEQASAQLARSRPDLIILDISMPGMGGLGFLKEIASKEGKPRFPVLVLTARSMLADFFQEVEVDGFIAKPCDETELTRIIKSILARRKIGTGSTRGGRRKILLAEDEEGIVRELVLMLKGEEYDVEVAGSGPELLEKAMRIKPDLVLAKEVLPRLNGSAVASLLDVMPSMSAVLVLLYNEHWSEEDRRRLKKTKVKCVRDYLYTNDRSLLVSSVNAVFAKG